MVDPVLVCRAALDDVVRAIRDAVRALLLLLRHLASEELPSNPRR